MRFTFVSAMAIASANAWSSTMVIEDVAKVASGIVYGAIKAESQVATTCFKDGDKLIKEIQEAVADFKKESFSGVKAGIKMVGTISDQVGNDIKDCSAGVKDIEKLIEMAASFKSPWAFAFHIGKDILLNGVDIYNDIDSAISNWDNSNYYNFGENLGDALAKVFVGMTVEYGLTHDEMLQVVEGVLRGALALSIPSADTCINDVEGLTSEVEEAVADFKKASFSGVSAGIEKVGDIVGKIQGDIADCKVSAEDAEKLAEMAKNFKSPWSFAFHVGKDILLNGVDIYHEISDAVTKYDNKDYYGFGYNVGEALEEVLIGGKPSDIFLQ